MLCVTSCRLFVALLSTGHNSKHVHTFWGDTSVPLWNAEVESSNFSSPQFEMDWTDMKLFGVTQVQD